MTKVRVCVGVNKQGKYHAYGESHLTDESLREIVLVDKDYDPGLFFSFHDLEVDSPQAPQAAENFEFGDLVYMDNNSQANIKQWAVAHTVTNDYEHISVIVPDKFKVLAGPTTFNEMCKMFEAKHGTGVCNGHSKEFIHLIAKAGQWHIANGEVVLRHKPEVTKPKFKRGDKVTRMQLGKLETWIVVDPVPDINEMIVLEWWGCSDGTRRAWPELVRHHREEACGVLYRMSYEEDCTLVTEVTAPQFYPGEMVVDQNNELWDVHSLDTESGGVWLFSHPEKPSASIYRPAHTLKKVVFGTL